MRWREWLQTANRLLELPLGPDSPSAPGLVPGHGDVDESLEEVTFGWCCCAPGVFELLVRGEVLAGPDQFESPAERTRALHPADPSKGLSTGIRARYAPAVATILLCGVDVYFRGKLEALLPGHHFVTSDSADWPDLVIADISRVDPNDVADSYPDVPIVGFGGHTDTAGLRRAHEAGFDQVLVKNALQERAPQIVQELIASVE